jgi:hypothetical protein
MEGAHALAWEGGLFMPDLALRECATEGSTQRQPLEQRAWGFQIPL